MQTLAAGSSRKLVAHPRGFTLLELLVVVAIIAIGTAAVAFAMRDSAQTQLEREAQRLAALLESGRAQSRTSGVAVQWQATAQGFRFAGAAAGTLPEVWLDAATRATSGATLNLGPEPIIAAQNVVLRSSQTESAWRVGTDGLRPFSAEPR